MRVQGLLREKKKLRKERRKMLISVKSILIFCIFINYGFNLASSASQQVRILRNFIINRMNILVSGVCLGEDHS